MQVLADAYGVQSGAFLAMADKAAMQPGAAAGEARPSGAKKAPKDRALQLAMAKARDKEQWEKVGCTF